MNTTEPMSKVLIGISCSDLSSSDLFSKSDPQISIKEYDNKSNQWTQVAKTEKIMNNLNPSFNEIEMDLYFERVQKLRFEVYDIDEHKNNSAAEKGDFLGQLTASLAQLARSSQTTGKLSDLKGKTNSKGSIQINVREVKSLREQFQLDFSATNLPKKGLIVKKGPKTRLLIQSISRTKEWRTVFTSNPSERSLNPVYDTFNIKMYKLTSDEGNIDEKIRICICDAGKTSTNYGEVTIPISDLIDAANSKTEKSWRINNSSYILLNNCVVKQVYTFLEYLQGGMELNLVVAIDFTGSNGDPKRTDSLHYLSGYGTCPRNDYTQAIDAVGRVVEEYDTDKLFPVFGFGAKLPPDFSAVTHDFAVNSNEANPNCFGVDGILQAYINCIPYVKLYGPTNFSPVIRHVIQMASSSSVSAQRYFVLLILTDGVISDLSETLDAIIDASNLPVSIIIIGVGNADFEEMNVLDSDNGVLRSADNRRAAKRDIVQFVPFNQFRTSSLEMLAKHVLCELPSQVTQFYSSFGISPRTC